MKRPAPIVEYRCDAAHDACLLLRVYAAPGGPVVLSPGVRLSPRVAAREGRGEDRRADAVAVPLAELEKRGVIGPVACGHRVLSVATATVRADYSTGLAQGQLRRFLPDGSEVDTR